MNINEIAGKDLDERYINLVKKRECFKKLKESKKELTRYSTFVCPRTHKIFSVVNKKDIDTEFELISLCDRECNLDSKDLNLQKPPDIYRY